MDQGHLARSATRHGRTATRVACARFYHVAVERGQLSRRTLARADCYYLPYHEGPEAEALLSSAHRALADRSPDWRVHATRFIEQGTRLRDLCGRLATLRHRPLFHALSRRVWDLREELDLLVRGARARLATADGDVSFRSDFHQPRTFRGGTVARLQRLLTPHADGTFTPTGDPA